MYKYFHCQSMYTQQGRFSIRFFEVAIWPDPNYSIKFIDCVKFVLDLIALAACSISSQKCGENTQITHILNIAIYIFIFIWIFFSIFLLKHPYWIKNTYTIFSQLLHPFDKFHTFLLNRQQKTYKLALSWDNLILISNI